MGMRCFQVPFNVRVRLVLLSFLSCTHLWSFDAHWYLNLPPAISSVGLWSLRSSDDAGTRNPQRPCPPHVHRERYPVKSQLSVELDSMVPLRAHDTPHFRCAYRMTCGPQITTRRLIGAEPVFCSPKCIRLPPSRTRCPTAPIESQNWAGTVVW
jgi:hypothetical protein